MELDAIGEGGQPPMPSPDIAQIRAIARQLGQLAGLSMPGTDDRLTGNVTPPALPGDEQIAKFAAAELSWRVKRNQAFGNAVLFGEPTWELLLDLFVHWERGDDVTVTSACIASGVPITTALRYMSTLIEAGLVVREPSAHDRRMHLVHLTPKGRELVRDSVVIRLQTLDAFR